MTYTLFDSTGNAIDAYTSREAAEARLLRIVDREPDAMEDVCIVVQDDSGSFVGEPIFADALVAHPA